MWKKKTAASLGGVSWGLAGVQAMPGMPSPLEMPGLMVVLSVAICSTMYLALTCYQRPLGDAYDLGYERGRRDAIREANRRALSPIRHEPRSLGSVPPGRAPLTARAVSRLAP